jgi:MSHA biogenesis protein MshK
MDEAVTAVRAFVVASLLAAQACAQAQAQALQDPTRPPARLDTRAGAAVAAAGGPQLQSVLIAPGPGGRHVAVIDGETVRLGEAFRGARVMRMTQNEVELVRGREHQVLKLEPSAPTAAGTIPPVKR